MALTTAVPSKQTVNVPDNSRPKQADSLCPKKQPSQASRQLMPQTLKDFFVMLKIRERSMIYQHQLTAKRQSDFAISPGFYFHETSHPATFRKIKPSRNF